MNELVKLSERKLSKTAFHFLLPWGLGDTMIFCGLKEALEKKLKAEIVPVIKPSHELIMKMYGIKNYIMVPFNANDHEVQETFKKWGAACPEPKLGTIYVAHPEFHPQFNSLVQELGNPTPETKFLRWYKDYYGVPHETQMKLPVWYPQVTKKLRERVKKLVGMDVEEITMVLPEANSANGVAPSFWGNFLKKHAGQKLLTNIIHMENFPEFAQIPNIDLTLEEITALCLQCKEVFAVRSGLCDLIFSKGNKLTVVYATPNIYQVFELKSMFGIKDIHESVWEDKLGQVIRIVPNSFQRKRLGPFTYVSCTKITRYYFLGINFFSLVEK